jgi:molecular chaperone GrpE
MNSVLSGNLMTDNGENKKPSETVIPITGPEETSRDEESEQEIISESNTEMQEAEYIGQLQRLQAEFRNYKKRIEKEWADVSLRAKSDFIRKLLPVVDDFERLLDHHDQELSCVEGVQLIYQKLYKILTDEGLEHIEAVGEEFDSAFHEAVDVQETGEDQDGTVLEEWETGYTFAGRMIRPSRVRVGKYTVKEGD